MEKYENKNTEKYEKNIIKKCWFCNNNKYSVNKYNGLGLLCDLCITKMKCFQMY